MPSQLLPASDLAPNALSDLPSGQRVAVWLDMLDAGYKLVIAGLARDVGPAGDLRAAYRDWYSKQMAEHDQTIARMLGRLQQLRNIDAR